MILTVLSGLFQGVGTMLTLCVYGIPKFLSHAAYAADGTCYDARS